MLAVGNAASGGHPENSSCVLLKGQAEPEKFKLNRFHVSGL